MYTVRFIQYAVEVLRVLCRTGVYTWVVQMCNAHDKSRGVWGARLCICIAYNVHVTQYNIRNERTFVTLHTPELVIYYLCHDFYYGMQHV